MFPDPMIEEYRLKGKPVFVARDDLCSPFPGPNFSKIRGLYKHLLRLREQGVTEVVSQDTSISRCGWGCSWLAKGLGMTHYNVYAAREDMNFYQRMSRAHGGVMVPVRGSYSSAMMAQARKQLGNGKHYLPSGFSLVETLEEHKDLLQRLDPSLFTGSVVLCVSSGTICAALVYGMTRGHVYGVMTSSFKGRMDKIAGLIRKAGPKEGNTDLSLVDMDFAYSKPEKIDTPFPCDLYLDRKAWRWLEGHIAELAEPVLFWNIGGEWSPQKGLVNGLRGDGLTGARDLTKWIS